MHKLLSPVLALIFLLATGTEFLAAQNIELGYDHRVTGDRSVTFHLGPIFPEAFEQFPPLAGSYAASNLTVGATLGIDLDFYLNDSMTLGGGVKFMTAAGVNGNMLFLVPITINTGWEFKVDHFSFPVGLGAGVCFTTYRDSTNLDPVLIPSAGAYWNMSSAWSFGGSVSQWIVFQPYLSGGTIPTSDSRIGYFADITLGAIYHF